MKERAVRAVSRCGEGTLSKMISMYSVRTHPANPARGRKYESGAVPSRPVLSTLTRSRHIHVTQSATTTTTTLYYSIYFSTTIQVRYHKILGLIY
jgi:hypothetical protein